MKVVAFFSLLGGVAQLIGGMGILFGAFLSKGGAADGAFMALMGAFLMATGICSLNLAITHLDNQANKGPRP